MLDGSCINLQSFRESAFGVRATSARWIFVTSQPIQCDVPSKRPEKTTQETTNEWPALFTTILALITPCQTRLPPATLRRGGHRSFQAYKTQSPALKKGGEHCPPLNRRG